MLYWAVDLAYLSLLANGALITPVHQTAVSYAGALRTKSVKFGYHLIVVTYRNSFLLPDLAPDMHTGPEGYGPEKVGETTNDTTVAYRLSVLADDVAWAEVDDDACTKKKASKLGIYLS